MVVALAWSLLSIRAWEDLDSDSEGKFGANLLSF